MDKKIVIAVGGVLIFILLSIMLFVMFENNDAQEVMVIQKPFTGELVFHITGGTKLQMFGKVTTYKKRSTYGFENLVMFNDGGLGTLKGSVDYELPLDEISLKKLYTAYPTQEALENNLVRTVVDKSLYMTGPLMSSKESYAEKRNYLIRYVEDQIENGIFKTVSKEGRTIDFMTGTEKTITLVSIVEENGIPLRQQESSLKEFNIRTFNFAIDKMVYSEQIEAQIAKQQEITMDVQTSIADAKKAEQRAITAEKDGQANAATAKWKQETINAQEIALAEKNLAVATLEKQTAEQNKLRDILEGQGQAEKKRLILSADGALEQKLKTYENVMANAFKAISEYQGNWVPSTVIGSQGSQNYNGAQTMIDALSVKALRDLSLDLSVPKK